MRLPKLPPALLAISLGLLATAWEGTPAQADASPEASMVLARVGAHTITVADFNRRVALVPPFQLKAFGRSGAEIKKNFLERVLVREALLAQAAEGSKILERDDVRERERAVLRNAMLARIRADLQAQGPVRDDEVKAYYDKNSAKFHTPPRIALWRIEVHKREEATQILEEIKKDPTPKRWNEIARSKSIDKATSMRGGNLGYVLPDGATSEPDLKVSKAVLDAVAAVKDTELVPEPVKDGDRWAVVWRRQSVKGVDRPLELEAGSIRQVLLHEKNEAKIKGAIAKLRADHLTDYHPELIEQFDIASSGDLSPTRRPGTLQPHKAAAPPAPNPAGR
jgi:peptidyl-prolyl cis-trans isomerase C